MFITIHPSLWRVEIFLHVIMQEGWQIRIRDSGGTRRKLPEPLPELISESLMPNTLQLKLIVRGQGKWVRQPGCRVSPAGCHKFLQRLIRNVVSVP